MYTNKRRKLNYNSSSLSTSSSSCIIVHQTEEKKKRKTKKKKIKRTIPRELQLMVCQYLSVSELVHLLNLRLGLDWFSFALHDLDKQTTKTETETENLTLLLRQLFMCEQPLDRTKKDNVEKKEEEEEEKEEARKGMWGMKSIIERRIYYQTESFIAHIRDFYSTKTLTPTRKTATKKNKVKFRLFVNPTRYLVCGITSMDITIDRTFLLQAQERFVIHIKYKPLYSSSIKKENNNKTLLEEIIFSVVCSSFSSSSFSSFIGDYYVCHMDSTDTSSLLLKLLHICADLLVIFPSSCLLDEMKTVKLTKFIKKIRGSNFIINGL